MTALLSTLNEKYEQEFFDRLSEKLEEIFPKTNQDNPEIPSEGNRSGALVLVAFTLIIFRDILLKYGNEILNEKDIKNA